MSMIEHRGLISVEFGSFYLVNFPYSPVNDPRDHNPSPGEFCWSNDDGIGFYSGYSGHRAAVNITWHAPLSTVPDNATESFVVTSPQLTFITATGVPEFTFQVDGLGRVSASVACEGREDIIRKVQDAPHNTVEGAERWTIHLWAHQSDLST